MGPLFPSEERIVKLFENNTYSVVDIFDVTLRLQLNANGVVEWWPYTRLQRKHDWHKHINMYRQVAGNSHAAKAGPLPTTRGFTGSIVFGDVIVAIDRKPVTVLDSHNHETQQFLDEHVRNEGELFRSRLGIRFCE